MPSPMSESPWPPTDQVPVCGEADAVLQALPLAAWIRDPETGLILDANSAAQQLIGFTRSEFRCLPVTKLVAQGHWADGPTRVLHGLPTGVTLRRRDGSLTAAMLQTHPLTLASRPLLVDFVFAAVDTPGTSVTHAAQALLHGVLTGTGDVVFAKDREGRYLVVNDSGAEAFGLPVSSVLGRTARELFPEAVAEEIVAMDRAVLERGITQTYETQIVGPGGQRRTFLTTKSVYRDGSGRVIGLLGIAKDISDRREAEEARILEAQRLEAVIDLQQAVATAGLNLDTLTRRIVDRARTLVGGRFAGIALMRGEDPVLEATSGAEESGMSRVPRDRSLTDWALRHRQAVRCDDTWADERVDPETARLLGFRSALALPLLADGEVLGVLLVGHDEVGAFSDRDLGTLQFVAGLLAATLNRALVFGTNQRLLAERTAALAARKESEDRFRLVADAAPAPIWTTTAAGHCDFVNEAFRHLTGRTAEDLGASGLDPILHEGDRPQRRSAWQRGRQFRHPFDLELRLARADGTWAWVLLREAPRFTPDGQFAGFVGIGLDLTERRRMLEALRAGEAHLREAVDAARLGIWDWNLRTGVVRSAGHFEPLCGLAPGEFSGTFDALIALVHPEDREAVNRAIVQALTQRTPYRQEYRVVHPDGTVRWLAGQGHVLYDPEDQPVRMTGALFDVTDRRVMEQQLVQAQKIEAIGQLAAGIAHEINTPTQYVSDNLRFLTTAFADLLGIVTTCQRIWEVAARGEDPATATAEAAAAARTGDLDYLLSEIPLATGQALDGLERVAELVRAMKDFSHPGTTEKQYIDLNRAIENTIAVARNEWKYVADVETHPGDLPAVPCLPSEFRQVMLNLLVNAAHAIGDTEDVRDGGRGRITVSTHAEDLHVVVRVEDTGTGIAPEHHARIFDPFFTTKDVGRGTGQGLAIAHDVVVNRHGGQLTFETVPGRGTTFILRLPLTPPEEAGV